MDSNTTALNTIKQEVNSVKGSVVEMNNIVDEYQIKGTRKAIKFNKDITSDSPNLLSLKGKGKLIGLQWIANRRSSSARIKKLSITKDGTKYDIFLDRDLSEFEFIWLDKRYLAAKNNYYITTGLNSEDNKMNIDIDIYQPDGFYLINGFPDTTGAFNVKESYLSDTSFSFDSSLQIEQETSGQIYVNFTAIYIIE